jgi:hypothetical protein
MYFRKFVFLVEDVVMLPMLVLNLMSWWNIILVARIARTFPSIFFWWHHRMVWKHGVELKWRRRTDVSVSNSSQTIIECFLTATQKLGIEVLTGQSAVSIQERCSMENRNTKRELSCWKINPCYQEATKYGKWCRLMVTQL